MLSSSHSPWYDPSYVFIHPYIHTIPAYLPYPPSRQFVGPVSTLSSMHLIRVSYRPCIPKSDRGFLVFVAATIYDFITLFLWFFIDFLGMAISLEDTAASREHRTTINNKKWERNVNDFVSMSRMPNRTTTTTRRRECREQKQLTIAIVEELR